MGTPGRKPGRPNTAAKFRQAIRQLMRVAGARTRHVPMWARLHTFVRNPEIVGASYDDDLPPALPGPEVSPIYGGLWDTLLQRWEPEATAPESVEQLTTWPVYAEQVPIVTFREPPVMRALILGGPGSGKTRTLSLFTIFQGGGLIDKRHHLTWGLVAATNERLLDPFFSDLFGKDGEPGLVPEPWILDKSDNPKADGGIYAILHNRCEFQGVSAKITSKREGSKVQGRHWNGASIDETQNVHDHVQRDVDERGRREGPRFMAAETATRLGLGHFEMRIERYKASPLHRIFRLNPFNNVFIHPGYWERFRSYYTDHEFKQRVLAEDVAPEQLVYSTFSYQENVKPAPRAEHLDVTRQLTAERFGNLAGMERGVSWVVGTDFGSLCTVSIWLKAFRDPESGEVRWWVMREDTSGSHTKADQHAKKLINFQNPADFIVIADPGINTKDVDASDYELTRRQGVRIRPAHHEPIRVKHRVSMLAALLCDADRKRRVFIDCETTGANVGRPVAPKLVGSFLTQTYDDRGNPENVRKDYSDPTHWPAALSYGLFPWEMLRGSTTFDAITGGIASEDPILEKARLKLLRGAGGGYPWV